RCLSARCFYPRSYFGRRGARWLRVGSLRGHTRHTARLVAVRTLPLLAGKGIVHAQRLLAVLPGKGNHHRGDAVGAAIRTASFQPRNHHAHTGLRSRKNPCKPWGVVDQEFYPFPSTFAPGACIRSATTTVTTTTGLILALDLDKFKSVACAFDQD